MTFHKLAAAKILLRNVRTAHQRLYVAALSNQHLDDITFVQSHSDSALSKTHLPDATLDQSLYSSIIPTNQQLDDINLSQSNQHSDDIALDQSHSGLIFSQTWTPITFLQWQKYVLVKYIDT